MGQTSSRSLSRQVHRLKCHAKQCASSLDNSCESEAAGMVTSTAAASSAKEGARLKLKAQHFKRRHSKSNSDRNMWCISVSGAEWDEANTTLVTETPSWSEQEEESDNNSEAVGKADENSSRARENPRCTCDQRGRSERTVDTPVACTCAFKEEVRASWKRIASNLEHYGRIFLERLLSIDPSACHVLTFLRYVPTDNVLASEQWQNMFGIRSLETVGLLVESLDDVEMVQPILASLGRRHICPRRLEDELKVTEESLLWMLEQSLREQWTPALACAWKSALSILCKSILRNDSKQRQIPAKADLAWTGARWVTQATPPLIKGRKKQSSLTRKNIFSSLEDLTRPCDLDTPESDESTEETALQFLSADISPSICSNRRRAQVAKKPLVRSLSTR